MSNYDLSLIRPIPRDMFRATAAMWSQMGDYLVVGGEDNVVRIYEAASGNLSNLLRGHHGAVTAVAWSPDDMRIMSAGRDRTVRIFYTDSDDVIKQAQQIQRSLEGR